MDISKSFLRQYLFVVAVNQGLMTQKVRDGLNQYDRATFAHLLEVRIEHLKAESSSPTALLSADFYSGGVSTMTEALENLDQILAATD